MESKRNIALLASGLLLPILYVIVSYDRIHLDLMQQGTLEAPKYHLPKACEDKEKYRESQNLRVMIEPKVDLNQEQFKNSFHEIKVINQGLCDEISLPDIKPHFTGGSGGENGSCVELGLSPSPLPLTALASFPGSGNTWVRHLIQQVTGIHTGSMYHDNELRFHGFPAEGRRDTKVAAIKTHNGEDGMKYDRALLLVRNPFDVILTLYNYHHAGHTNMVKKIKEKDWREEVNTTITRWLLFHQFWLRRNFCMYIIFYDNLMRDLRHELVSVAMLLGVNPISANHLDCVVSHSEGNFHRKSHQTVNYTEEEIQHINDAIVEVEHLLQARMGQNIHLCHDVFNCL